MTFNSYIPTKLAGLVDLIWEQEIPIQGNYTVLPSGKVELLFPLYHNVDVTAKKILTHENPVKNYSCFLSGLHTKPLKMTFDKFHTFGIQMKPVAVKALFGIPLCNIKDYFVEGDAVLDTICQMEDKLHSVNSFTERAHWFENFLLKRINETADLQNAINLDTAINKHLAQKQNGSSKSIENLLGYSRTQTFRLFNDWFGMSAHSYLKLLQFIRTVETLHNKNVKLIDISYNNGYYDQSHFIHTFQEFADMTPGEYRKQMTLIPDRYSGNARFSAWNIHTIFSVPSFAVLRILKMKKEKGMAEISTNKKTMAFAGYVSIAGAVSMLAGAVLLGASETSLWLALADNQMESYLSQLEPMKQLLLANTVFWIFGVLLFGTAGTLMSGFCSSNPRLAQLALVFMRSGVPIAIVSFIIMLSLAIHPPAVESATNIGWIGTRLDDLATILIIGASPLFLSIAGRTDWVPGWLAVWGYLAGIAGLLGVISILSNAVALGFVIIPFGIGWMIAAGVVLIKKK